MNRVAKFVPRQVFGYSPSFRPCRCVGDVIVLPAGRFSIIPCFANPNSMRERDYETNFLLELRADEFVTFEFDEMKEFTENTSVFDNDEDDEGEGKEDEEEEEYNPLRDGKWGREELVSAFSPTDQLPFHLEDDLTPVIALHQQASVLSKHVMSLRRDIKHLEEVVEEMERANYQKNYFNQDDLEGDEDLISKLSFDPTTDTDDTPISSIQLPPLSDRISSTISQEKDDQEEEQGGNQLEKEEESQSSMNGSRASVTLEEQKSE